MAKEGSTISGLMDSFATAISLSLQHGVPLKLLVDKFSRTRFEPSGFTGNPEIPRASSIMDYLFRWLAAKFVKEEPVLEEAPPPPAPAARTTAAATATNSTTTAAAPVLVVDATAPASKSNGHSKGNGHSNGNGNGNGHATFNFIARTDAPTCAECGSIMVPNGSCHKCINCGTTSGCS
jgi:ribonucleoside-diphosphate reductase alpha chain